MPIKIDVDDIRKKLKSIYQGVYDFPHLSSEYTNSSDSKITIICPIHGSSKLSIKNMISQKSTCKKCSTLRYSISIEHGHEFAFWILLRYYKFVKDNCCSIVDRNHDDHRDNHQKTMLLYSLFENTDEYQNCLKQYQAIEKMSDLHQVYDKPKRNYFIVWNDAKTEGFITDDHQLAYETCKGSDTNCYTGDGRQCNTAIAFIGDWEEDSCIIEEVQL